jgi:aldehyde dehydrogenase (NAD+)
VWAWNAAIALVCGDPVVWKPSEKTPLTAVACMKIAGEVMKEMPDVPPGILGLVIGKADVGEAVASSEKLPLISATGSTRMGKAVAQTVAKRLGRSLLELGGNNAMIVTPSADLELALRAITFAAAGTAGQRCTTLRRLIVHESLAPQLVERLKKVFSGLKVGDPAKDGVLVGPLIDQQAFESMQNALGAASQQGGKIHGGERVTFNVPCSGFYAEPAIVEISPDAAIAREETFAPILYVMTYRNFEDAVRVHNDVPQGLSSAVFTSDVREAEEISLPVRQRLRHRQRQHRHQRRRDRRRLRRRKANGRRPRERFGRVEGVHAPRDEHDQLFEGASARPGHRFQSRSVMSFVTGHLLLVREKPSLTSDE